LQQTFKKSKIKIVMRVYKLASIYKIGIPELIEIIQTYKPANYQANTTLDEDIVLYIEKTHTPHVDKPVSKKEIISETINRLHDKVNFDFKFNKIEIDDDLYSYNKHQKYIFEISHLKFKKNKYAQLDDLEVLKLIKSKVKSVVQIQKKLKKERRNNSLLIINSGDVIDNTANYTSFENPWNDVFGEGDEANDAYWNTE
jgi:hypothetical protein